MTASYSSYERELKGILAGDHALLKRYRKSAGTAEVLAALDKLEEKPFLVVRAAGSHGFDLVALRDAVILPIEVKCSGETVVHFTASRGRNMEQYVGLRQATLKAGLVLLYAYRLIGGNEKDPWRLFCASNGNTAGVARYIANHTPTLDSTAQGNQVMRWSEGKPLTDFLSMVVGF